MTQEELQKLIELAEHGEEQEITHRLLLLLLLDIYQVLGKNVSEFFELLNTPITKIKY